MDFIPSKESCYNGCDLYLSDKDQVGRALRWLVKQGLLVKVGQGLYAKTKLSSLSGNRILEKSIIEIAKDVLQKYNYKIGKTKYEKLYEEGKSTQVLQVEQLQ